MIEYKGLWKSYNGHAVLKGLNLTIHDGETLVILGRSGCGKSVLLRHILGMEKPDQGAVVVDGVCISELNEHDPYNAIREMGMLFQGSALFDSTTVGENTAFYLRQHNHHSEKEIKELTGNALKLVGLEGKESAMPSDLSGGMRKRAALARLIVYRPKILLYDEPTTGLDPITSLQIDQLMRTIQKELNATSIVVTHDLCSAFRVADRIAFNHGGEIVHITTKEEFVKLEDPTIQTFLRNSVPGGEIIK